MSPTLLSAFTSPGFCYCQAVTSGLWGQGLLVVWFWHRCGHGHLSVLSVWAPNMGHKPPPGQTSTGEPEKGFVLPRACGASAAAARSGSASVMSPSGLCCVWTGRSRWAALPGGKCCVMKLAVTKFLLLAVCCISLCVRPCERSL